MEMFEKFVIPHLYMNIKKHLVYVPFLTLNDEIKEINIKYNKTIRNEPEAFSVARNITRSISTIIFLGAIRFVYFIIETDRRTLF